MKNSVRPWILPLLALLVLLIALWLTPAADWDRAHRSAGERIAHALGHGLNSVWVGVSLLALAIPAWLARARRGEFPLWAWRALDAIALDFLCVDAIGKTC